MIRLVGLLGLVDAFSELAGDLACLCHWTISFIFELHFDVKQG